MPEPEHNYIIGVSSGIFGAATQEERFALVSLGLARKVQYALTKGVNFVQIDLESISEFREENLKEKMKSLKTKLGLDFAIHGETVAFGTREFPHLDSAIDVDYRRGQERLVNALRESGEIESKYFLMHSSESTPFIFLGRELQPTTLVDIWGRSLDEFLKIKLSHPVDPKIEGLDPITNLLEWTALQSFTQEIFLHGRTFATFEKIVEEVKRSRKESRIERFREEDILNKRKLSMENKTPEKPEVVDESEYEKFAEVEESELPGMRKRLFEDFKENIISFVTTRSLAYGPERLAYYVTAKWMQETNDPLWSNIINKTIEYYARKEGKTREQWLLDHKINKIDIEEKNFRDFYQLWVPAVSAKYVWGHFMPETMPLESSSAATRYPDPKALLKKYNLFFVLETPMASPGTEDLLRFANPVQMYFLIKELNQRAGAEITAMAIDLEHMLMDGLNPEVSFQVLPEDGGRLIKVIHTGWPSPLGPAHIPIPLGSDQQIYLYKTYYNLRQKGMGKNPRDKVYVIFERVGGPDPIQQSVLALREIQDALEKDIPPERLPLKFFGLEPGQWQSTQRQWVNIREHAFDPLKGMITAPEEEHTFLGRAAIEKGKSPQEWKKEELK